MLSVAAPINQLPLAPQPQIDALRNANARFEPIPEPTQNTPTSRPRGEADDYDRARASNQPREAEPQRQTTLDPRAIESRDQTDGGTDPREQRQERRQEQAEIRQLSAQDRAVRAHEAAHAAVGGQYAGAPRFTFTRGPDGQTYAVAGEVSIDSSPVPGDADATIRKLQTVRRAALAPVDPSNQDRRVAAQASSRIARARAELALERQSSTQATGSTEAAPQTAEADSALPGATVSLGSDTLFAACPFCSKPHLQPVAHTVSESIDSAALSARLKSRGVLLPEDRSASVVPLRQTG